MFCVNSSLTGGTVVKGQCPQIESKYPEVFGPVLWASLHTMAANYAEKPTETRISACEKFVTSLPDMLPCAFCGAHFRDTIEKYVDKKSMCDSQAALSMFFCEAHNVVNQGTGKLTRRCDAMALKQEYGYAPLCTGSR